VKQERSSESRGTVASAPQLGQWMWGTPQCRARATNRRKMRRGLNGPPQWVAYSECDSRPDPNSLDPLLPDSTVLRSDNRPSSNPRDGARPEVLIIRSILAVVPGLAVGMAFNMAIVMANAYLLFPMPAGMDMAETPIR
jgi:hypothetical protein